jgi:glycosyltransferase involved in cell wall biosynthesis
MVGLDDYPPYHWCISRLMAFMKSDWEEIGGFNQTKGYYGGHDSDFCIRFEKAGKRIIRIPKEYVTHHMEDKKLPPSVILIDGAWLITQHPLEALWPNIKIAVRFVRKEVGL